MLWGGGGGVWLEVLFLCCTMYVFFQFFILILVMWVTIHFVIRFADVIVFLFQTLGCRPIASVDHFLPENLGSADLVEEVQTGSSKVVKVISMFKIVCKCVFLSQWLHVTYKYAVSVSVDILCFFLHSGYTHTHICASSHSYGLCFENIIFEND